LCNEKKLSYDFDVTKLEYVQINAGRTVVCVRNFVILIRTKPFYLNHIENVLTIM